MSINPMRFSHQWGQSVHRLDAGCVRRLAADRATRRLRVLRGMVWITADGQPGSPSGDIWLMAGDEWVLPAGVHALMEGWPKASVEEIVATEVAHDRPLVAAVRSLWVGVAARLGFEVRRGGRLVGIEGPVRMARRAARVKGRRSLATDWGGLYNAGIPHGEA